MSATNTSRYTDYRQFLSSHFEGKVQKISINAGFSCPNRDGTKGTGGCTYCNNLTFSPEYTHSSPSVGQQIEAGISFFSRKYPTMRYLAYFQSYTNTYGDVGHLISLYREALAYPEVVGVIISTRPDMVSDELLAALRPLSRSHFIMFELGAESTLDRTLDFINRRHSYADFTDTVERIAASGIYVGAHLILGLPHESTQEIIHHATSLSHLPLSTIKLHQLQIIRQTRMHKQWLEHPEWFPSYTVDEYIDLCIGFLEHLSPAIAIERFVAQSPPEWVVSPHWGLKNHEFTDKMLRRLEELDTYQGKKWS
ncbi:MAG: TIGR01212 family radical SAM protein [Bacteroidales bacterium]